VGCESGGGGGGAPGPTPCTGGRLTAARSAAPLQRHLAPPPEYAGQGVLVGHPKHDHAAAVMAVEVDALRHLAARHAAGTSNVFSVMCTRARGRGKRDGAPGRVRSAGSRPAGALPPEEDCPAAAVARAPEVVQRQRRLHHVLRLDEHQLVRHQLLHTTPAPSQPGWQHTRQAAGLRRAAEAQVPPRRAARLQDAHVVPARHDLVHVEVGDEEADDAVGHGGGQVDQQAACARGRRRRGWAARQRSTGCAAPASCLLQRAQQARAAKLSAKGAGRRRPPTRPPAHPP
jgi:hypothetical protein